MVHRRQKLTPERVAQLAAACKTRSEFGKKHSPAYKKACDWGILDEVCAHMAHIGNHAIRAIYAIEFSGRSVYVGLTYNYDKRYSEHKNRKGLQKRFTSLTHYFRRFDEWLPIEEAKKKEAETIDEYRKNGWTILNRAKAGAVGVSIYSYDLDEVTKLVKGFASVGDFRKEHPNEYNWALKHGHWADISQHLTRALEHGKHSKQSIARLARDYNDISEFAAAYPSEYSVAVQAGYWKEISSHMPRRNRLWPREKCFELARSCESRIEFQRRHPGAYQACCSNGWLDEACAGLEKPKPHNSCWDENAISKEAKKYRYRSEFSKDASGAYAAAKRLGILDTVCSHMTRHPGPKFKWDLPALQSEALKYKSRSEFQKKASGAYSVAARKGCLDRICSHMVKPKRKSKQSSVS